MNAAIKNTPVEIVVGYENKKTGREEPYLPYQDHLDKFKPVTINFESWDGEEIKNVKSVDEMPNATKNYLAFLSATITPISLTTYGPGEEDYHPWNI